MPQLIRAMRAFKTLAQAILQGRQTLSIPNTSAGSQSVIVPRKAFRTAILGPSMPHLRVAALPVSFDFGRFTRLSCSSGTIAFQKPPKLSIGSKFPRPQCLRTHGSFCWRQPSSKMNPRNLNANSPSNQFTFLVTISKDGIIGGRYGGIYAQVPWKCFIVAAATASSC